MLEPTGVNSSLTIGEANIVTSKVELAIYGHRLVQLAGCEDVERVRRINHSITSSCANVGPSDMGQLIITNLPLNKN